jgi:hypothetical protein
MQDMMAINPGNGVDIARTLRVMAAYIHHGASLGRMMAARNP